MDEMDEMDVSVDLALTAEQARVQIGGLGLDPEVEQMVWDRVRWALARVRNDWEAHAYHLGRSVLRPHALLTACSKGQVWPYPANSMEGLLCSSALHRGIEARTFGSVLHGVLRHGWL